MSTKSKEDFWKQRGNPHQEAITQTLDIKRFMTNIKECCEKCYEVILVTQTSSANEKVITFEQIQCSNKFCPCHTKTLQKKDTSLVDNELTIIKDTSWEERFMDIENLSSILHQIYEKEMERQGRKSKHPKFYHELTEDVKDLDRALARYILEWILPKVKQQTLSSVIEEIEKLLKLYHLDQNISTNGDGKIILNIGQFLTLLKQKIN